MILIFLSDISWTGLHQRPHHVALALSKRWTVLWVEPITLGHRVRWSPELVEPNLHVVSLPEIPYNARQKSIREIARLLSSVRVVRRLFTALQRILLRRAAHSLVMSDEPIGCMIYAFTLIDALAGFHFSFTQFEYIDNVFGFTSLPSHVKDQWVDTLRTVDFVTVSSRSLAQQIAPYRSTNVHYVGNGVEYQLFAAAGDYDRPPDLPQGKPIAGYVGAVYPWLDYQLLQTVCSGMPDVRFVFIGPVHPDVSLATERLGDLSNVHFLGAKPYQQVPAYLHHLDVGIIPFQKNELTFYVNPVKLYEYSASGTPSVVTDFSEDVVQFKDHICVATTAEEFISCVRNALAMARDPVRIESLRSFARGHAWETKTTAIIALIERQISSSNSG